MFLAFISTITRAGRVPLAEIKFTSEKSGRKNQVEVLGKILRGKKP